MRHFMLALLILLLPLRGWTGDAMATGMAAGQLMAVHSSQPSSAPDAIKKIADHAHDGKASAHIHPEKTLAAAAGVETSVANIQTSHDCGTSAAESSNTAAMDCGSCSSCQACHTVALSSAVMKSLATLNPAAQPEAVIVPLASADAALSQKPPIS